MGFEKGHKKVGGRKKGSGNKLNNNLRESISLLIQDQWHTVSKDIENLTPKNRLDIITKLLDYVLPRLNKVNLDSSPRVDDLLEMSEEERWNRIRELNRRIDKDDR